MNRFLTTLAVLLALAIRVHVAYADELTGIDSDAVVPGPDNGLDPHDYTVLYRRTSPTISIHVEARTTSHTIDTTECPSLYASLGSPTGAGSSAPLNLSIPSFTVRGYLFVTANVGTVGSPIWHVYYAFHSSKTAMCSWSTKWVMIPDLPSPWVPTTAPSAVTVDGGSTYVFVVGQGGTYPTVFYRIFRPDGSQSSWFSHDFRTACGFASSPQAMPSISWYQGSLQLFVAGSTDAILYDFGNPSAGEGSEFAGQYFKTEPFEPGGSIANFGSACSANGYTTSLGGTAFWASCRGLDDHVYAQPSNLVGLGQCSSTPPAWVDLGNALSGRIPFVGFDGGYPSSALAIVSSHVACLPICADDLDEADWTGTSWGSWFYSSNLY